MAFEQSPPPIWPTGDPTGIAYYSEWDIAFKKFDVAARRDQARATAYAAELHYAAMTAETRQVTSYSPDTLQVLRDLTEALNNLGASIMPTSIRSRPFSLALLAPWVVSPTGTIGLSAGQSFALAPTLPTGVPTGGTFELVAGTLPAGATLDKSTGLLSCGPTYTPGVTLALEFEYRVADTATATKPAG
jgi:hypothetical protein